jgi:CRP-like cAMP-binding protein/phosphopantetheinyl transferase (holo-ACP synthase)
MASEKAQLTDTIQKNLSKSNWKAAISDMEKLFHLEPDPIIRVRIGDAYQKLNQVIDAVREYIYAADLFAIKGAIVKALAQYKLAIRLDPKNKPALDKMASLHSNKAMTEKKLEPSEEGVQKPVRSVIPLFAGFTQEEFEDFTKMMAVHTLQPGHIIVKQGDTGKSVYIIASGTVKVHTVATSGERLDLAVLSPNEFFGEISFLTGKARTATVETAEEAVILEVTEDQLHDLINRRPRVLQVLQQYSDAREIGTSKKIQSVQKQAKLSDATFLEEAKAPQKMPDVAAQTVSEKAPPAQKPPDISVPSAAKPAYKGPAISPLDKPKLIDAIQKYVSKSEWKSVITEMEKLYTIDPDPIIRVRIGDAYQKLNQKPNAVCEYMMAADLYAAKGAVVKSLAQYKLALRVDPGNKQAEERIEALHSNKTVKENRVEPTEKESVENVGPKRQSSIISLFAGFSQEEFNDFTKVMNVHPLPGGLPIVEQNDQGKSVYLIASGSVNVFMTLLSGERVDLAVLRSGDFFGEISFLTGKPRTATVETAEDAVILEITEDKLREITSQRPHILSVLQQFSDMRSKGTTEKILGSNK